MTTEAAIPKAKKRTRKPTATKSTTVSKKESFISPPPSMDKHQMISEAAYYIAEKRGFVNGCEEDDWFEAETQINELLEE